VKILAVSDVVLPQLQDPGYVRRTFGEAELLISCGDMSPSYLEFISTALNLPLFFVRGNHDERYVEQHPGGDNLHKRIKVFRGFSFAGLEGSINYNQGKVQYTETQMFTNVLWMLPRLLLMRSMRGYGVDVLMAHSPPLNIHDLRDDRAHRGFRSFRYLMQWACPRFFLHGHVDTWDNRKPTETIYHKTTVINVNPYKLLTLDKESHK
jgi:Icc-related predicted phosphoesterase